MKITIDTKQDSHDDIKKVVQLLSQMLGENAVVNEPEQQQRELPEESGTLLADIFGPAKTKETARTQQIAMKTKEEDNDKYEIIPY